ncbi:antitoxin Xre/MbcA/ParS toxin-binding domain-containing protein [Stenotrophomonas sp. 24(2023)]|uniref:antitoxin Xre/MbcA/ParS toxin-binding domain-containing protein n=1 Tax=Stenotrophomonas sp. 24(2023) TaxID=3068324 RepID=UPI0027E1F2D2|nr:antitoxin Xre/MbcA/ParS toxin-binding domain-containing protein [Stenotrophomonas sp. 24(2023)]WMJ70852.1 DUF2384 domain-containing protein [Stenotrophomonas sp. 24(2023)]
MTGTASKPRRAASAPKRVATRRGATGSTVPRPRALSITAAISTFRHTLRDAPTLERVKLEREGVQPVIVRGLIDEIGVSAYEFQQFLRIPKATFAKKMRDQSAFSGAQGQSVIGLLDLITKVEDMLAADPGPAGAQGFDVEKWVGHWIRTPQPALGGRPPAELMDTPSGRESVMRVLGAIQSGAYQ